MKKLKTKQKIIKSATQLFNQMGVQNINSRHIAAKLEISHGNVDYHYNNKEDLILAIYEKMRKEMSNSYLMNDTDGSSLENFYKLLIHIEKFQEKFRFFNLDVLEISRTYPKISKLLEVTLEMRKQQMHKFYSELIKDGYLDNLQINVYERLMHSIRIIVTFWLPQKEILTNYKFNNEGEMVIHICELVLPYLSQKGIDELEKILSLNMQK